MFNFVMKMFTDEIVDIGVTKARIFSEDIYNILKKLWFEIVFLVPYLLKET